MSYGCFKEVTNDHNSKRCTKRRSSKTCDGKYSTTLHGYVRKKRKVDHNVKIEIEKQQNGMKPAVVVSMCVVSIKIKHGNSGNVAETYALLDSCSQCTFMLERLIILK